MTVLITGGAGYIGSHTALTFLENNIDIVVVDNFCNSHPESLARIKTLSGKTFVHYDCDFGDRKAMERVFEQHQLDCVIHFAGLKAVGESNEIPLKYYQNNVANTLTLCALMEQYRVANLVFSSSATVYGDPEVVPITETQATTATNPYGSSKLMVEIILKDLHASAPDHWKFALLRYFNPIGAHSSGHIGESPNGIPNNLLPYVSQVASGKLEKLRIFGDDYDTADGTGVRDYIHVMDLALGHLQAYRYLQNHETGTCEAFNLGTGVGYSVKQIVESFERISGKSIPFDITPRRPGDIACCYADATKAKTQLDWHCEYTLDEMIEDAWRWQSLNPKGYE